jgi:branched-chain amino acid transport system ATP-binding protein
MLEVRALGSRYGRIPALTEVALDVRAGELVAIVGANGAGKTTLLRTLSGVQPMHGGTLRFEGADIGRETPRQRVMRGIVQVPEGRQVFGALSVEDNLLLGAYARGRAATIDSVWVLFPVLRDKRAEDAGTLSGGQQQMLAIGRALMADPRLLLLDEPSMGLAPRLVAEIFNHIKALKQRGTTILLVDQNARAALAVADRGYVMETGRIASTGAAAALLSDPKVKAAYLGAD